MSDAETRYAQIEKEMLGITFACERFHQFIFGAKIQAETDHKPLISIFHKPLADCPLRIQRLKLRVQRYDLEIMYTPGKFLVVADALSRATDPKASTVTSTSDVDLHVNMIIQSMPVSAAKLEEIRKATTQDTNMMALQKVILDGWPRYRKSCPANVVDYWNIRDMLSIEDGIVLKGSRIVIPVGMRTSLLQKLHEGHLGVEKTRRRARQALYWPGLNADISDMIGKCEACIKFSCAQQAESLLPHDIPAHPWQKIGIDIFTYSGQDYLIVSDYYSRFPEVMSLSTASSKIVINSLKSILARHGTVDVLVSDNGPQFVSSEFKAFVDDWEIQHITSSPYHAKSNGLAESAVKSVKNILKKCLDSGQDIYKGLLAYRAAPLENGMSPAQMLMGRRLKTSLPMHPSLYGNAEHVAVTDDTQKRKLKQKSYYDRFAQDLPPLKPGDRVRIQDHVNGQWEQNGTVLREVAPRSYEIQADNGAVYRRNRVNLKPFSSSLPEPFADVNTTLEPDEEVVISSSYHCDGAHGEGAIPASGLETPSETMANQSTDGAQEALPLPRRGERLRKPPQRLIENM